MSELSFSEDLLEEVHHLASACFHGEATAEDCLRLEALVCNDAVARRIYIEYAQDSVGLIWLAQSENADLDQLSGNDQPSLADQLGTDKVASASHRSNATRSWRRGIPKYSLIAASVAALLLLAVVPARLWPVKSKESGKPVARLRQATAAVWQLEGREIKLATGEWLTGGTYTLTHGLAKIAFPWGTEVTLEAPVALELSAGRTHRLLHGQLIASVSEDDSGFTVDTPAVRVIDLGTEFGVTVDDQGTSEVHVFKGSVEARPATVEDGGQASSVTLLARQARSFTPLAAATREVVFNARRFSNAWQLANHVSRVRGMVQFVHPPPPSVANDFPERNDAIVLFRERERVTLTEPLAVTVTRPGLYTTFENRSEWFPAGVEFDSYLMHFDPVGSLVDQPSVTASGSVTFDRPILAVIMRGDQLAASDSACAAPETKYLPYPASIAAIRSSEAEIYYLRGLMGLWNDALLRSSPAPNDQVRLSADRRTLAVRFTAGGEADQLRVLVATYSDMVAPAEPNVSPLPTPFRGRPFVVGELIQAEDFDHGGEGVAYFDTTPNSLAVPYRNGSSVELRRTGDAENSTVQVVRARAGEWLAYTVQITEPGDFMVRASMSSGHAGSSFHVEFSEEIETSAIVLQPMENSDNAIRVAESEPLHIDAGEYVIRVVMDKDHEAGWVGNFDWFQIVPVRP